MAQSTVYASETIMVNAEAIKNISSPWDPTSSIAGNNNRLIIKSVQSHTNSLPGDVTHLKTRTAYFIVSVKDSPSTVFKMERLQTLDENSLNAPIIDLLSTEWSKRVQTAITRFQSVFILILLNGNATTDGGGISLKSSRTQAIMILDVCSIMTMAITQLRSNVIATLKKPPSKGSFLATYPEKQFASTAIIPVIGFDTWERSNSEPGGKQYRKTFNGKILAFLETTVFLQCSINDGNHQVRGRANNNGSTQALPNIGEHVRRALDTHVLKHIRR